MNLEREFLKLTRMITELQTGLQELKTLVAKQPTTPVNPEFLTRKDVCNMLGITLPTLASLMKSGKIPFSRLGKNVRFTLSDVQKAMQTVTPAKPYK